MREGYSSKQAALAGSEQRVRLPASGVADPTLRINVFPVAFSAGCERYSSKQAAAAGTVQTVAVPANLGIRLPASGVTRNLAALKVFL